MDLRTGFYMITASVMKGLKTYLDKGGYLRLDKLLNLYIHSHCMTRSSFQQRFFLLPNDDIAYRFTV